MGFCDPRQPAPHAMCSLSWIFGGDSWTLVMVCAPRVKQTSVCVVLARAAVRWVEAWPLVVQHPSLRKLVGHPLQQCLKLSTTGGVWSGPKACPRILCPKKEIHCGPSQASPPLPCQASWVAGMDRTSAFSRFWNNRLQSDVDLVLAPAAPVSQTGALPAGRQLRGRKRAAAGVLRCACVICACMHGACLHAPAPALARMLPALITRSHACVAAIISLAAIPCRQR